MPKSDLSHLNIFAVLLLVSLFTSCALLFPRQHCADDYKVNFKEALLFVDKADLAYQSADSVMRACGTDSCFVFTGATTQAAAIVQRDESTRTQWIAFRGTATISDAELDADYTQVPDSSLGIYLHSGFVAASNDLLPVILPVLRHDYQTNVTGHSLGGADAVISALRLQKLGYQVKVYTFGQPKITNMAGVEKSESLDLTRFVDDRDVVALMPPVDWKPGKDLGIFMHFGREIDLRSQGFACMERHYDDVSLDYLKNEMKTQAFKDHGLAEYRIKIALLAADSVKN